MLQCSNVQLFCDKQKMRLMLFGKQDEIDGLFDGRDVFGQLSVMHLPYFFGYKTGFFFLPKQSKSSRSVL